MTKEKKFSAQTVRVPVELEKAIGHLLVETGESFQSFALRLIQSEIANLGKPKDTNPGDPPLAPKSPRELPRMFPAIVDKIMPAITTLIQDGRGGLVGRFVDLLEAMAKEARAHDRGIPETPEKATERARAIERRALGGDEDTPGATGTAGGPRKPKGGA